MKRTWLVIMTVMVGGTKLHQHKSTPDFPEGTTRSEAYAYACTELGLPWRGDGSGWSVMFFYAEPDEVPA